MVIEQICCTCRESKPLTEFHKNRTAKSGHHRQCKACVTVYMSERWKSELGQRAELKAAGDTAGLDRLMARHRKSRANYKRNRRDRWNTYQRKRNAEYRAETIAAYGGACFCCGETNELLLTLDHVNNDGASERRAISSAVSSFYYARRLGFPDTYRLACYNCNCGRQRNLKLNGDDCCPHQVEREAKLKLVVNQ